MNHISWENGKFLGFAELIGQKTIKTLCGKRVKLELINDEDCDCEECKRIRDEKEKNLQVFDNFLTDNGWINNAIGWNRYQDEILNYAIKYGLEIPETEIVKKAFDSNMFINQVFSASINL